MRAIPRTVADEIIVVDNGSSDRTAARARAAGARVVGESRRGYGQACAAGVAALPDDCDIVVFLDGDGSDVPALMATLVEPIRDGRQDFVIGSRTRGRREPGSMSIHQIMAGRLAAFVIRRLYGVHYSDMCPFRAIDRAALRRLPMTEATYGWNLEMQVLAARDGLRIAEIPVEHRRRSGGHSKVSGTVCGTVLAAVRIIVILVRTATRPVPRST